MKNDEIKKIEEQIQHLKEWLSNLGTAQEAAPYVQRKLEQLEWERDALIARPDEADEIPSPFLITDIDRDYIFLKSTLPMMPRYDISALSSSDAYTTSGTASVYSYVNRVGDLNTPSALEYSTRYTRLYHDLETTQNRPNAVRQLLEKHGFINTINRFDEAFNSYYSYKAGVEDKKSAALAMRNFVDGIKGDLFGKAKKHPTENMTWETMTERLMKRQAGEDNNALLEQERRRSTLISRLSDVLKDRESGSATDIEAIWIEVVDHAYVVLNLVQN